MAVLPAEKRTPAEIEVTLRAVAAPAAKPFSPFGDKPSEEAAPEPVQRLPPPASPVRCVDKARQGCSVGPQTAKKAKKPAGKKSKTTKTKA